MSKGSAPDPKMSVTVYRMSIHMGICQGPVDRVKRIFIGEKLASDTPVTETTQINIDNLNLFGGEKKEGGVRGSAWALFGDGDQTMPSVLAARLGRTVETSPGFRGLLSLFFARGSSEGFVWGHNTPYLKPVWIEVERLPGITGMDWYPETAAISRDRELP
jgi:hypothetical protein